MDIVELTSRVIGFRSLSYHEMHLAEYLAALLGKHGIKYVFDRFNPGKFIEDGNVYPDTANIYIEMGKGSPTLLLYAHMDVVDGNSQLFHPSISDGYLIGRGAVDMKSSLAGLLVTLYHKYELIMASGKHVMVAFVADEPTPESEEKPGSLKEQACSLF